MATRRKRPSYEVFNLEKTQEETQEETVSTNLEEEVLSMEVSLPEVSALPLLIETTPEIKQEKQPRPTPAPRKTLFPKKDVEASKQRNVPKFS